LYKLFDKLSIYTPEDVPSPKKKGYIIHDIFNDKVSLNIPGKMLFEKKKWLPFSDTIIDKIRVGRPVYASSEMPEGMSPKLLNTDKDRDKFGRKSPLHYP
jgi:hypothetical protein